MNMVTFPLSREKKEHIKVIGQTYLGLIKSGQAILGDMGDCLARKAVIRKSLEPGQNTTARVDAATKKGIDEHRGKYGVRLSLLCQLYISLALGLRADGAGH